MFDDGGGPPRVHKFSRGIRVSLDFKHMTASLVREYDHRPPIASAFEGGEQLLSNGDMFVGWGQQPYFTEFDSHGRANFDAHFTVPTSSYRAYRFPWSARSRRLHPRLAQQTERTAPPNSGRAGTAQPTSRPGGLWAAPTRWRWRRS